MVPGHTVLSVGSHLALQVIALGNYSELNPSKHPGQDILDRLVECLQNRALSTCPFGGLLRLLNDDGMAAIRSTKAYVRRNTYWSLRSYGTFL